MNDKDTQLLAEAYEDGVRIQQKVAIERLTQYIHERIRDNKEDGKLEAVAELNRVLKVLNNLMRG